MSHFEIVFLWRTLWVSNDPSSTPGQGEGGPKDPAEACTAREGGGCFLCFRSAFILLRKSKKGTLNTNKYCRPIFTMGVKTTYYELTLKITIRSQGSLTWSFQFWWNAQASTLPAALTGKRAKTTGQGFGWGNAASSLCTQVRWEVGRIVWSIFVDHFRKFFSFFQKVYYIF